MSSNLQRITKIMVGVPGLPGPTGPTGPTGPAGGVNSVNAAMGDLTVAGGTNITVTESAGVITVTGGITDEVIRDVVGAALTAGDGVTVTIDDVADTITIANAAPVPVGGNWYQMLGKQSGADRDVSWQDPPGVVVPTLLFGFEGDLAGLDRSGGIFAVGAGAVRYRDGYAVGTQASLVEEATNNLVPDPFFVNTTYGTFRATRAKDDVRTSDGERSIHYTQTETTLYYVEDGIADISGLAAGDPVTTSYDVSHDMAKDVQVRGRVYWYDSGNVLVTATEPPIVSVPAATAAMPWTRVEHSFVVPATAVRGGFQMGTYNGVAGDEWWFARPQVEQDDSATSFTPERVSGTLQPGYAWTGVAHASASTRAVTTISIPTPVVPASMAFRYSEDGGATWQHAYLTVTGPLGTYGTVAHDGTNLVIGSTRSLQVADFRADDRQLTAAEKQDLEAQSVWAWTENTFAPFVFDRSGTFPVKAFGAVGDGVTNDRAAVQAAIDAAIAAGGGIVYFPTGTYKVQITETGKDVHCLTVDGNNVTLRGAPGAAIQCYVEGGDPDTNWQVVAGEVWRGSGVYVTGGVDYANRRRNFRVENLEIHGNFSYTGNHVFPADTITGDGWDITHKGIWYQPDLWHDGHAVIDSEIHGFSGEVLYVGGSDSLATRKLGNFWVIRSKLHESNASIISLAGNLRVIDCEIYDTAGAGIEEVSIDGHMVVRDCWVHDTDLDGISFRAVSQGLARASIINNRVERANGASINAIGIELLSAWYSQVRNNICIDCGISASISSSLGSNTVVRDIDITDNTVLAHQRTFQIGITAPSGVNIIEGLRIHRNRVGQTDDGIAGGFICNFPLNGPTTEWAKVDLKDNDWQGANAQSDLSKAYNQLLTTTGITNVAVRRPSVPTMFRVDVSYEVITAATNVTVNCRIKSINNGAFTIPMQAIASKAVGVYALPSIMVPMAVNDDCRVNVTAGTANQVYVYATITEA